jgi:formylglycine-generating enzyme required for sulfatase activity
LIFLSCLAIAGVAAEPAADRAVRKDNRQADSRSTRAESPAKTTTLDLGGEVKMEFVWIEALKGWVGKYEVTNQEYRRFKKDHDSGTFENQSLNDDRQPVVNVSYNEAVEFAGWVNRQTGSSMPSGYRARLPDGKEWFTFAQCGDGRTYPWGNDWPPKYGNYADATAKRSFSGWSVIDGYDDGSAVSCAVEKSGVNDWGLYGVGGNVWEWTSEEEGSDRVPRGASWRSNIQDYLRCGFRRRYDPADRDCNYGFRLVVLR